MKKWNVRGVYSDGDDIVKLVLKNRGFESVSQIDAFLTPPPFAEFFEQFDQEFKDALKKAKEIIGAAVQENKPIIIHGDYDADGISATAILYSTVKNELGYGNTHYFIPNRFRHGYGLSRKSLEEIFSKFSGGLLITVDCGVTANAEVTYAKERGFEVIITDHHQKSDVLPDTGCIVWSDKVVGAGVSWILSRVLGSKNPSTIALAALATVTDLQQVLGINRTILKKGLAVLNTNPPIGLKKLVEIAGRPNQKITSYDLGWLIGPRLNASGRLVEAEEALKLLLAVDPSEAYDLAVHLNNVNSSRQDKTLEMTNVAGEFDENNLPKIIFSAKEEYHEGIIGLVAAKLAQKYYRPAVVISLFDGQGKGSVRSIPGVNIIEMLRELEDLFESLGGHPMAAGFLIKAEKLGEFEEKLKALGEKKISENVLVRSLNVDLQIPAAIINEDLYERLSFMEPFGIGNEEPVFCSLDLGIISLDKVGKEGQHLSMRLYDNSKFVKAIYFGGGSEFDKYRIGDKVDIAYTLNKNVYQGKVYIDLVVKDLKKV